ncbi:MAG: DNA methyltransferase [Acidimicrobiales bacterium]
METGVRIPPRRSIVRDLVVGEVAPSLVAPLVVDHHYLHSMPPAAVKSFGVYLDGGLVGAVVVTSGSRNAPRLLGTNDPRAVATLARLWLEDRVPKNAESRVLAVVARLMRHSGQVRALVSYADPAAGHTGTIYQAAGWTYLGMSPPGRYLDLGDGEPRHPRSVFSAYGTNRPACLRKMGLAAKSVLVGGKHRYCLVLDQSWAWRLTAEQQPYPRPR